MNRSPREVRICQLYVLALLFALASASAVLLHAQTFTVIHNFGNGTDGSQPNGAIYEDSTGNIYGATSNGGMSGVGVIYKIDQNGNETILHNFDPIQGNSPNAGLAFFNGTWLFGITQFGGSNQDGTVFAQQVSPPAFKNVHSFSGSDGQYPVGTLVVSADGATAYGVTSSGGLREQGEVYQIDKSGNVTVLYSFEGIPDGSLPNAGLLLDSSRFLYGTTAAGGVFRAGTFFRIIPTYADIYDFQFTTGGEPNSTPIADGMANAYGTTGTGGSGGGGVLYKLNLSTGVYLVLHAFQGAADGSFPVGDLSKDGSGHLYGVTDSGGSFCNCGVVYRMDATGNEIRLHSFAGPDGANPNWLYRDPATGILYGTTTSGGTYGEGVLFRIMP